MNSSLLSRQAAYDMAYQARDSVWFSLGAYALLTQPPSNNTLPLHKIIVSGSDLHVVSADDRQPDKPGLSYSIAFDTALDTTAARSVVNQTIGHMLIETYEAATRYAISNGMIASLEEQDWYSFARHYRNALVHNGRWEFKSKSRLPVTWRGKLITYDLNHESIEGYLDWFQSLQLGACMFFYIQKHAPTA